MHTLYAYDSANYAFALRDYYNVVHHHPHPPGYPLYVAAAKLLDLALHDPNSSLVLLSALASVGAVVATFYLAEQLFGRWIGLVSAILLTFTVGFWGYGEVAYPYTSLSFWLALGAALCFHVLQGRRRFAVPLGAALAVGAGFRWDAALFLAPLWIWSLVRVDWLQKIGSLSAFVFLCLAWFVPMVWLSGGPGPYYEAVRSQSEYIVGTYSPFSSGRAALELNLGYLVTFLRQMYGLNLLLVLYTVGRVFSPGRLATDFRMRFLLVWLLPAILIYLLVHIGEPGYLLSIASPLAIVAGLGLVELHDELGLAARVLVARVPRARWAGHLPMAGALVVPTLFAVILAYQAAAFLASPGPGRLSELRLIDATQEAQFRYLRTYASPGTSIILAHDQFRQTQYELPGYDVRLLFDEYASGWREGRTWNIQPAFTAQRLYVLDGLDQTGGEDVARGRQIVLLDEPRVVIWEFDLHGIRSVAYGYRQVRLEP